MRRRAPAPALRPYVVSYTGYAQHGVTLALHRGLPSCSVTLVISLADPIRMVRGPGAEHGPVALQSVVAGLSLAPTVIAQDRYQEGLHLELNPLGVRALLGVSATELTATTIDLADLPVPWARHLAGRLAEAPDWESRFAMLDAELTGALRPVTLVSEIRWAWQAMLARHGSARITPLAEEIGWSRRHFGARFAREVGVTPKQVARLMRFQRTVTLLRSGGRPDLADLAVRCGYYDQAHLTNEWRALAGCTPMAWIREELPFLQEPRSDGPADSSV